MTAHIRTKRDILKSLTPYLPMTLLVFVFYALIAVVATIWLLYGRVSTMLLVAAPTGVLLVVTMLALIYVHFIVNRIARFHLSIEGGTLTIGAQMAKGLVERRYQLSDIESVEFGQMLNLMERGLSKLNEFGFPDAGGSMKALRNLKAGQLVIKDFQGHRDVFNFIGNAFDDETLSQFAAALEIHRVEVNSQT